MDPHAIDRPTGPIHTVPTEIRALAGELHIRSARATAALDRAWIPDASYRILPDLLVEIAERALELRRKIGCTDQ